MSNQFTDVIYNQIPRNSFDLSHSKKFSMNMGTLTPFLTQEVVPGDSFNITQEQMIRMAPMVAPVMDKVRVDTHFFFVPNRLLWEGWEDFITQPENPLNPAPFFQLPINQPVENGSLMDYLGYPTGQTYQRKFNPFPIAGYRKIYNEYYRDQNLQSELDTDLIDGLNAKVTATTGFDIWNTPQLQQSLYKRAWAKDYFTSALPFPQKGQAVTIGLAGTAPILYDSSGGRTSYENENGTFSTLPPSAQFADGGDGTLKLVDIGKATAINTNNASQLKADLSNATAITINDLRTASKLQEWLEVNARSGSRYIESIKAHYGVTSRDARLQRPEFLGGGSSNISFSEVLQQSASDDTSPQGNMSGHGINVGNSRNVNYRAEEHGFIIGIISVKPDNTYHNPTPKWSTRLDPLDYLFPLFAQLGEQPILNYEVKGDYSQATADDVFGYQSKYAEYKNAFSTVHGDFKTNLDFWHMARKFESDPILNKEFIEADPTQRIFAVTDETDKLYVMLFNKIQAVRPLPRYNIPSLG